MYNTEKQMQEHAARIPQNIKDQIQGDISSVNEAIVAEDPDKIEEALERLKNSSLEIGKAIYSQSSDEGASEEQPQEEEQKPEEEEPKAEEAEKAEGEKKEEEKK